MATTTTIDRPAWMLPSFIVLPPRLRTSSPAYVNALDVCAVQGAEHGPTAVYLRGVPVPIATDLTPAEVFRQISDATR